MMLWGDDVKKLAVMGAALFVGWVAAQAEAQAAQFRFFDPMTRSWIESGPRTPEAGKQAEQRGNPIPREVIAYRGPHGADTVIVDTSERRLYYVLGDGTAVRYGVGVGRAGFEWTGTNRISRKAEWPGWTPPPAMIKRRPELAKYAGGMPGGPNNPLGARAMYLGSSLYRIHGSNEPWSIGQAVSSGCIRMANEDVIDLYDRVRIGTKVVVQN